MRFAAREQDSFRFRGKSAAWHRRHLERLAECGIRLAPGVSAEDVKGELDSSSFVPSATVYEALLCVVGEDLRGEPMSPDVFYFDIECINDDDDYLAIGERLKLLIGDALPIEDMSASAAWDDCWLAFRLGQREIRFDLERIRDYVDWELFRQFNVLLGETGASERLALHELGQDSLMGCFDREQLERVNGELQLEFKWIE